VHDVFGPGMPYGWHEQDHIVHRGTERFFRSGPRRASSRTRSGVRFASLCFFAGRDLRWVMEAATGLRSQVGFRMGAAGFEPATSRV
jgi:hypothetical protein